MHGRDRSRRDCPEKTGLPTPKRSVGSRTVALRRSNLDVQGTIWWPSADSGRMRQSGRSTTRADPADANRDRDHHCDLDLRRATPDVVNHRPESRVRENRTHGSEGGGRKPPYPYPGGVAETGKPKRARC
jgi:hypothetical protein